MERIQIGRLCGHMDVVLEYELQSDTSPTTVIERYICQSCSQEFRSQDHLEDEPCN